MVKLRLNHVALTVSDRDRSAQFYAEWFGLGRRLHDDDHLLILTGDADALLALSEGEVPKALPRTNHFGFEAQTPDHVRQLRKKAETAGVEIAEWQENSPTRLQILDPDGYRVEFFAF